MLYGKEYYESMNGVIIKPSYIMYKHKKYDITYSHPSYHIKKYFIIVNNKRERLIQEIIIHKAVHPNAWGGEDGQLYVNNPPEFSKFCLPDDVIGAKLISDSLMKKYVADASLRPEYRFYSDNPIRFILNVWALDDPHHFPTRKHVKTTPPLPWEELE